MISLPLNLSFKVFVCFTSTASNVCISTSSPYDISYTFTGTFNSRPFIWTERGKSITLNQNWVNYIPINWYDWDQFQLPAPANWNVFAGTNMNVYMFQPSTSNSSFLRTTQALFSNNYIIIDSNVTNLTGWTKGYMSIYDGKIYLKPPTGVPKYYLFEAYGFNFSIVPTANLLSSQPVSTFWSPFCFNSLPFTYQMKLNNNSRSFLTVDVMLLSATAQDTLTPNSSKLLTNYAIHYKNHPGLFAILSPLANYVYTLGFLVVDKVTEAKQTFNYVISCYSNYSISMEMSTKNILPNVLHPVPNYGNNFANMWIFESKIIYTINVKKNNNASLLAQIDIANIDIY